MFCWEAKEFEFKKQIFQSKDLRLRRLQLPENHTTSSPQKKQKLRRRDYEEYGASSMELHDIDWKESQICNHSHQIINFIQKHQVIDENTIPESKRHCSSFQYQKWISITTPQYLLLHYPQIDEPNMNVMKSFSLDLISPIMNMRPVQYQSFPTVSVVTSLHFLSPNIDSSINSSFPLWISPFLCTFESPPRNFHFDEFLPQVNHSTERSSITQFLIHYFKITFLCLSTKSNFLPTNHYSIFDNISLGCDLSLINETFGCNWIHSVQITAPYSCVDQKLESNQLFPDPGIIALDDTLILEVESCHARQVFSERISYGFIIKQIDPKGSLAQFKSNWHPHLHFPMPASLDLIHHILSSPNHLMYITLQKPKLMKLWSHKSLQKTYDIVRISKFPRCFPILYSDKTNIIHDCLSSKLGQGNVLDLPLDTSFYSIFNSMTMINNSLTKRIEEIKENVAPHDHSNQAARVAKRKAPDLENFVEVRSNSPPKPLSDQIRNSSKGITMKKNDCGAKVLSEKYNPTESDGHSRENDFLPRKISINLEIETKVSTDMSIIKSPQTDPWELKIKTANEIQCHSDETLRETSETELKSFVINDPKTEQRREFLSEEISTKKQEDGNHLNNQFPLAQSLPQLPSHSPQSEAEMSDIINSYLQLHGCGNEIVGVTSQKTRDLIQIPTSDPQAPTPTSSFFHISPQPTKQQFSVDQMEGLTLLISEDLLVQSPIYSTLLFQKYKIRCVDAPLESPLAFIVDEMTGICLLFYEILSSRENLKAYLRKLTSLAFKFNILWLVIVSPDDVTLPQDLFASLCQALSHFPCSVEIRYCRHLSVASLVHKLCHEAANFAAVQKGILLSTFKERPMLDLLDNMVFSAHCMSTSPLYVSMSFLIGEFLQLFPTINYLLAARILHLWSLKALPQVTLSEMRKELPNRSLLSLERFHLLLHLLWH
jgi:hypothetical protein